MYLTAGTATAGKTIDVTLNMKNDKAINSWQTTVALPEGFTLTAAAASGTRYGEELPQITSTVNEDGTVTLFCELDEGVGMTGTDGAVATLTLSVNATVAAGEYMLTLKGATMIDITDKVWTRTEDFETAITVEEATGISGDVDGDGQVTVADIDAILEIMLTGTNDPAGDVDGDGMVTVADIDKILDIMLEQ